MSLHRSTYNVQHGPLRKKNVVCAAVNTMVALVEPPSDPLVWDIAVPKVLIDRIGRDRISLINCFTSMYF